MPERSHNKEVKATPASIAHYYPPKRGGEAVAKRQPIDEGGRSDTDIDRQVAEQQKAVTSQQLMAWEVFIYLPALVVSLVVI